MQAGLHGRIVRVGCITHPNFLLHGSNIGTGIVGWTAQVRLPSDAGRRGEVASADEAAWLGYERSMVTQTSQYTQARA